MITASQICWDKRKDAKNEVEVQDIQHSFDLFSDYKRSTNQMLNSDEFMFNEVDEEEVEVKRLTQNTNKNQDEHKTTNKMDTD